MDLRLLGPLEVQVAGGPVALGGVQQRAVLAMLALHLNQAVATGELVEGLWGERAPAHAINVVQVYVSRLRKVLQTASARDEAGAAALRRRGSGYLLELEAEHVDLYRFQRLAGEGVQVLAAAPARAVNTLREALGLWRGQPLSEFADQPFSQSELPRLEQQRLAVVEVCLETELALGRHVNVVSELEALVAAHPFHEGLRRLLMLSLYRCSRQAEALQVYRRARNILAEELGIDPARGLRELEAAILTQDPSLDWTPPVEAPSLHGSVEAPPAPVADPRPHAWHLPIRNPYFTGRDGMLAELRRRLHEQQTTLVVQALYGLGGVGKTQLALEYAHRFAADYDLIWWIDAEQPILIPDQLARLATRLNLPAGATVADTVDRLLADLRHRTGWLLIFDNANHPEDIAGFQPGGAGHVLITSRYPGWGALGGRLEVDVLTRVETIALLQVRISGLSEELAGKLAAELGDLPLAAAQAAGYLEQTGLPPADYLRRFREHRATLLACGDVLGYHGRIDTTWALSVERLRAEDPAAVQLLELVAFLAPEPIPLWLISNQPAVLDEPLRSTAADPDTLADSVGVLFGYSLARRHAEGFQVHRLLQAMIRHRLPPNQQQAAEERMVALLGGASPGDPEDSATWVAYAQLAPHVLAAAPLSDHSLTSRRLVLDTARYLQAKGDSSASRAVSEQMLDRWRSKLGPDHPDTLTAASLLTLAVNQLGEAELARVLGEDTLQRCRRILGPDDPTTLWAAAALAVALLSLGDPGPARALGEDTLQRCRRVFGPDHATTLWAAAPLTLALTGQGAGEPARVLGEDTLERCRRVLGLDHATTLFAAAGLTVALIQVGEAEPARALGEDTVQRCRRMLGPDHPRTLLAAAALTHAMAQLGEAEPARALGEDTVQRCRRVLGPDYATTLWATAALTHALVSLGEAEVARTLGEDTLDQCRRVLGSNHPITLYLVQTVTTGHVTPPGDAVADQGRRPL